MAGLLTEKIRESQKRKSALDLWKGLLDETGIPELFSGRIGGQTLEQGIQNRMEAGSLRPALSPQQMVDAGLNIVGMAPLGMFIGKGAKTWDAVKADQAMKMEKAGKPPREIWAQTGNWKGPDGQWRQEIPDNTAKQLKNAKDTGMHYLDQWIAHPELQGAYPKMFDHEFAGIAGEGGILAMAKDKYGHGGSFTQNNLIVDGATKGAERKSTTLHELQHAIQEREGWARGGSLGEFVNGGPINPKTGQLVTMEEGHEMYRRLAGEAEARATQARMNMDMPQRLATFPEDSFDVPMDQLIVRYGDGPSMSTSRPLGLYPWAVPLSAGLLGSMFLLPNDAEAQ